MKQIKLLTINFLTLIVGLGLMTGSIAQQDAFAARFDTVPSIEVSNLGNYRGQHISLIYAIGAKPLFSTNDTQVILSQVKETRTQVIKKDQILFSSLQVEKEGFRPSYNMILIVISPNPNFTWINADGSIPRGVVASANKEKRRVLVINRADLENLMSMTNNQSLFKIKL